MKGFEKKHLKSKSWFLKLLQENHPQNHVPKLVFDMCMYLSATLAKFLPNNTRKLLGLRLTASNFATSQNIETVGAFDHFGWLWPRLSILTCQGGLGRRWMMGEELGPGGGDHDLYHYHDDNRQCNHDHGSHSSGKLLKWFLKLQKVGRKSVRNYHSTDVEKPYARSQQQGAQDILNKHVQIVWGWHLQLKKVHCSHSQL